MGYSHNVLICNRLPACTDSFQFLRCLEINQIFLHQSLRQLISGCRNHTVSNHASVLRNTDIGGSCPNIDQRNIQKPVLLRNRNCHCRDRLQSKVCYIKSRLFYCCIQAVYNFLGKKCCKHICSNLCSFMAFEIQYLIIIQEILHNRIANTKILRCLVTLMQLLQDLIVCLLHTD